MLQKIVNRFKTDKTDQQVVMRSHGLKMVVLVSKKVVKIMKMNP